MIEFKVRTFFIHSGEKYTMIENGGGVNAELRGESV